MYNHKLNLFRDYPFSDKKDIPIDDIFLVLPIGTSFCSITGCKKNHIKITTNTIEEWVIVDQLVNNTKYGTILLDEYINVEKTFINTLIETRWVVEPDGLNNIYINGERIQSVGWDNNTTSEPQYIRELVCPNGTVCGNDITIYGEHIINVSGTDFSTSIDDVRCPIKIKESAKGDKGETGDKGDAGRDGEHIFQYLSDPDSCVDPCSSVDQYNVEVCSIPIPEEPYEDGDILDPPDPIDCGGDEEDFEETMILTNARISEMHPDYYESNTNEPIYRARRFLNGSTSPVKFNYNAKISDGVFNYAYYDNATSELFVEMLLECTDVNLNNEYRVGITVKDTLNIDHHIIILNVKFNVKNRALPQTNSLYAIIPNPASDNLFSFFKTDGEPCLIYTSCTTEKETAFLLTNQGTSIELLDLPAYITIYDMTTKKKSNDLIVGKYIHKWGTEWQAYALKSFKDVTKTLEYNEDASARHFGLRAGHRNGIIEHNSLVYFMTPLEGTHKSILSAKMIIYKKPKLDPDGNLTECYREPAINRTLGSDKKNFIDVFACFPRINETLITLDDEEVLKEETGLILQDKKIQFNDVNYFPRTCCMLETVEEFKNGIQITRNHIMSICMIPCCSTQGNLTYLNILPFTRRNEYLLKYGHLAEVGNDVWLTVPASEYTTINNIKEPIYYKSNFDVVNNYNAIQNYPVTLCTTNYRTGSNSYTNTDIEIEKIFIEDDNELKQWTKRDLSNSSIRVQELTILVHKNHHDPVSNYYSREPEIISNKNDNTNCIVMNYEGSHVIKELLLNEHSFPLATPRVSIDEMYGVIIPIDPLITVYEEWDTEFEYPMVWFSGECLAVRFCSNVQPGEIRIDSTIGLKEANNVDLVLDWFGIQTTISVGSNILEIPNYEYHKVGIGFSGYCKYYKADSDEYFYYPIITADIVPEQFRYSLVTETGGKHYYFNTGVKALAKYKGKVCPSCYYNRSPLDGGYGLYVEISTDLPSF